MMRKLEVTIVGFEFEGEKRNVVTRTTTVTQEIYQQYFLPFIQGNEQLSSEIIDYFGEGDEEFFHYVDDPDWDWMVTKIKEVA